MTLRCRLFLFATLASSFVLTGCLGGGIGFSPVPRLEAPPGEPWTLPVDAVPTQRLFRMRYRGDEGKAGLKVTLYLTSDRTFRMRAADSLGRKVWELSVDENDEALWLDHRGKQYCSARSAGRLAIVPLAYLPLKSLPHLLLGRLPATPMRELDRTKQSVSFLDERGRRWNGGLEDGRLTWWTRLEDGEAITWWRLEEGEENVYVDLENDRELRWKEVVREPLATMPPPLEIPKSFREGMCG